MPQHERGMIGTKPSGSAMSLAPPAAASAMSPQAFSTDAGPSSTTGVACTTATRTIIGRLLRCASAQDPSHTPASGANAGSLILPITRGYVRFPRPPIGRPARRRGIGLSNRSTP